MQNTVLHMKHACVTIRRVPVPVHVPVPVPVPLMLERMEIQRKINQH
jgi:hypothetical protein